MQYYRKNRMSSTKNNIPQRCRWHSYRMTGELESAAVQAILHAAEQAISQRGAFNIVLAGGTTPRKVYERLCNIDTDWAAWHVYFGDERCLPADHAERNSRMAAEAWLDHVAIPHTQVHPIPAESGAEIAACAYSKTLEGITLFDLVLLGLGEDGHTASLFPNHELGNTLDAPATIAVLDAPKLPPHRVSLSAHRLSMTRQLIFLVTGASKQQAVKDWRNGGSIPAAAIAPACGVDVYVEAGLSEDGRDA
jgi:6-phosphogluconolactonase